MDSTAVERFVDSQRAAAGDGALCGLYGLFVEAIRSGTLPPGARLPSSRQLAATWALPRGAVDEAMSRLQADGLVERRVGSGSFVTDRLRPLASASPSEASRYADAATQALLARLTASTAEAGMFATPRPGALRLRPGAPDTSLFPLEAWRRALAQALSEERRAVLSYGMPGGVAELREAIARYLSLTRGLRCRPEQVLVVGSPRQGIELIARTLLAPGENVCVEDPGPLSMTRRFSLAHMRVTGVAPDAEGLDVAAARRLAPDAAAVVLQPMNAWPGGARLSAPRREQLLRWSAERGCWLVELDSLGEIVHEGAAPPALFAEDPHGRTIFIGTFVALMFPALRIAYLVLPEPLVEAFVTLRGLLGEHSPVATQAALAHFIDEGHLAAHVRAMRRLYRARRDALVHAAHTQLPPGARLGPVEGGIHACLHVDARWPDRALADRLQQRGIAAQPLSRHAWEPRGWNGLLIGFGADDEAVISASVGEIGAILRGL